MRINQAGGGRGGACKLGTRFAAALVLAGLTLMEVETASASTAYGVTEANVLVRFDTATPGTATPVGTITGTGGQQILAIDFRPLTGRLYGVSATHLYLIDPSTAAGGQVSPFAFAVTLSGDVGMDFDPVSGFIRVVTSTQNFLVNPLNGTVTTQTAPSAAGVVAAAFTNNFASPDRATLYGINASTNGLVRIGAPDQPDGGASQAGGVVTPIGALGVDASGLAGFDIAANGNRAYAVMATPAATQSTLYTVNLASGAATSAGVIGVAARLRAAAVLSRAVTVYGLTVENALVTFLSAVPGTLLPMPNGTPVPIAGLGEGEQIVAIDTRPATGELYGLSSGGRLFVLTPATGHAALAGQLTAPLSGDPVGFDFDPQTDRLRVTTDTVQNLSVNPAGGFTTAESPLSEPGIVGLAYTNNVAGTSSTALFGVDATSDRLYSFADPSDGVGTQIPTPLPDLGGANTGFDVSAADGIALLGVTAPGAMTTTLYAIELPGGTTTAIGEVGGDLPLRGLAIASPGRLRLSAENYSVQENAVTGLVTVQRESGTDGPVTVKLRAQPGSATSPSDFIESTFTVELGPDEVSKTVNVIVLDDGNDEADETILLSLVEPMLGASLTPPTSGTLTIVDNDPLVGGGNAPTVAITAPTDSPSYTATSLFITLAGRAADAGGTVSSVAWTNDRGPSGTASLGAPAENVDWFAPAVRLAAGVNTITVTATDDSGNVATDVIVVTVTDLSYYLAEGATGTFFDLDLLLANPNASPITASVTFLKPSGGGTVTQQFTLPATSRTTVTVDAIPGLEGTAVSAIVTAPATHPLIVERTMRWDSTGYGAHTDKATPSASNKWYFAEGSQGFFFTYLLLANPHPTANEATVTYFRENSTAVTRTYPLAAFERLTVDAGADPDLVDRSFGMEVTFVQPGIAERAMYFDLDPLWIGGHESMGETLPSREWFLAEGATGTFFTTFVLFANPSAADATVNVRYLPAGGSPVTKTYVVPAQGRLTKNIEIEEPALANASVATEVSSDLPIIVERAQYWPDPPDTWYEAHNSFGVTATGTRWGLAEGRVGGDASYSTFILLANPGTTAATVTIDFLRENGTTVTKEFTVQPATRFNVDVGSADVPELANESFGAVITSTQPIAVERAMYSTTNGVFWQVGTNATATRLP